MHALTLWLRFGSGLLACSYASFIGVIIVSTFNVQQGHLKIKHYYLFLLSVKNICVSGAQKQS